MSYELASSFALTCADRRGRYRPRSQSSSRDAPTYRVPLSSGKSEKHAREGQGAARWRRIQKLSKKLSGRLTDDARSIWLELEEALNAHWLDVATDQYKRGVEAGSGGRMLLPASGDDSAPAVRLKALVIVLSAIADELEDA